MKSRVPTKHVAKELKQSVMPERDVGAIGGSGDISHYLEQLQSGEVRNFKKTMGEVTNGGPAFDPGETLQPAFSEAVRQSVIQ